MSSSNLKTLTITNVRGYVHPFSINFEKGKKLCIVYGENGTGKSTLCDALQFLGSGTMGSLEDKGLGRTERYWAPAESSTRRGSIKLTTTSEEYEARFDNTRVSWKDDKRPRVAVLRRAQLLKLLTAPPSERYKAIAELIDVSGVEESEQALIRLQKSAESERSESAQRVAGAQSVFGNLFATSQERGDAVEWARREANRDITEIDADAKALRELDALYDRLDQINRMLKSAQEGVDRANSDLDRASKTLSELRKADESSDEAMVSLLQAASRVLAGHADIDACPLCESTERANDLHARITSRLAQMSSLRGAVAALETARSSFDSATNHLSTVAATYADARANYQKFIDENRATTRLMLPDTVPPEQPAELETWLTRVRPMRDVWHREAEKLASQIMQHNQLRNALRTYDENHARAEKNARLANAAEQALTRVSQVRRRFVNDMLSTISTEVGRLYEQVHPGEGLDKISLNLASNRRASLELSTEFLSSSDVPPQAYFSESHLDTLGLCVFLALAKNQSPRETILVLDDVLASVDEPHVDRLIEMIYQEAQHFRHVIVTTHYRPWREKLRWGWLKYGQCQVLELGAWRPSIGPTVGRSTGEIQRLRSMLSARDIDHQSVASKAGVVLEAALAAR